MGASQYELEERYRLKYLPMIPQYPRKKKFSMGYYKLHRHENIQTRYEQPEFDERRGYGSKGSGSFIHSPDEEQYSFRKPIKLINNNNNYYRQRQPFVYQPNIARRNNYVPKRRIKLINGPRRNNYY